MRLSLAEVAGVRGGRGGLFVLSYLLWVLFLGFVSLKSSLYLFFSFVLGVIFQAFVFAILLDQVCSVVCLLRVLVCFTVGLYLP